VRPADSSLPLRPSQLAVLEAGQRARPRQAPVGLPRLLQRPARPRLGHRGVEGARRVDDRPPKYKLWQQLIIGACAAAFIQPSAFYGSFIDCLMAMPLGALLVLVQVLVSRNDLYSSLFECVSLALLLPSSASRAQADTPSSPTGLSSPASSPSWPPPSPRPSTSASPPSSRARSSSSCLATSSCAARSSSPTGPSSRVRHRSLSFAVSVPLKLTFSSSSPSPSSPPPHRFRSPRLRHPVLALPRIRLVDRRRDLPAHHGSRHRRLRRLAVVHVQLTARSGHAVVHEHDPAVVV